MPRTFTYQWQRFTNNAWQDIPLASLIDYTPVTADLGRQIRERVLPSDGSTPAYSNSATVIAEALLRVEYATPASPPITSYAGEVGTLTGVDSGSLMTVAGGEVATGDAGAANGDPALYNAAGHARTAGRRYRTRFAAHAPGSSASSPGVGWATSLGSPVLATARLYGLRYVGATALQARSPGGQVTLQATFVEDTYDILDFLLMSTGMMVFVNKLLVWVWYDGAGATLYPVKGAIAATLRGFKSTLDDVRDIGGDFDTDLISAVNVQVSPVSSQDYSGAADILCDLTGITLPGSPSGGQVAVELRYNKLDASNYNWQRLQYNGGTLAWDMLIGITAAGSPTTLATVAGVGTPDTMRVIHTGSLHDSYSAASDVWTKRGAQITNANQSASTGVQVVFNGGTAAMLVVWGRSRTIYDLLDSPDV